MLVAKFVKYIREELFMKLCFSPLGVCARQINVDIDDRGIIQEVSFIGGCDGNHKGLCRLVEGEQAKDVIRKLRGVTCGIRDTSCPDQLAEALNSALQQNGSK